MWSDVIDKLLQIFCHFVIFVGMFLYFQEYDYWDNTFTLFYLKVISSSPELEIINEYTASAYILPVYFPFASVKLNKQQQAAWTSVLVSK